MHAHTRSYSTIDIRDRAVLRVLWLVLGLNLVVAVSKFVVGYTISSLSLLADSIHSLLDASANIVGLVGIVAAARPPDADHPYGHRRFEAISAVFIGVLIVAGMVEVIHSIVSALIEGHQGPRASLLGAAFVTVTVVVNLAISYFERKRGRHLKSTILLADAAHTMTDALAAAVVLVSFVGVALNIRWADLMGAAIVAILIGKTAYTVLKTNLNILADGARLDPHKVHAVVMNVEGVRGAHKIRSRGLQGHVALDLHVQVDPSIPVSDAHRISHRVSDQICAQFNGVVDVIVHIEPADGRELDMTKLAPGV